MTDVLTNLSRDLTALIARLGESVVAVHAGRGAVSGFIWRERLIVTAEEALEGDEGIAIGLADGRRAAATLVGRDASTDVALLRINEPTPAAVDFDAGTGRSAGEMVVALGRGNDGVIAALGIVAAAGPAWHSLRGGLVDAKLRLDLRLNSVAEGGLAIAAAAGQPFGMTVFGPRRRVLVIPGATIERVASHLLQHGRMARGYLGLGLQPVRLDGNQGMGVMIVSVDANGPGQKAGLVQGDIITHWAGEPLAGMRSLSKRLGPGSVGQTVELTVRHGGEPRQVTLIIAERPAA